MLAIILTKCNERGSRCCVDLVVMIVDLYVVNDVGNDFGYVFGNNNGNSRGGNVS